MNIERYPVVVLQNHKVYEFFSDGPAGAFKKVVHYQEIDNGFFNIAFGDWDADLKKINDYVRNNNGDGDKIVGTIAFTITDFMTHHPWATIFAKGNTIGKTRLYQIRINKHWPVISQLFDIEGFAGGKWKSFQAGINYSAFTLKAKTEVVNLNKY